MLARYAQLRDFLRAIGDDGMDLLHLNPREDKAVDALLGEMTEWDSITVALQRDSMTVAQARDLFDFVCFEYPAMVGRLGADADIVAMPGFETALVKVQRGLASTLTDEEILAVAHLRSHELQEEQANEEDDGLSLAERALKRQRTDQERTYVDTRFLVPTSNMCERLFSDAKMTHGDRRGRLLPVNFEAQLFLHANTALWGAHDVQLLMNE